MHAPYGGAKVFGPIGEPGAEPMTAADQITSEDPQVELLRSPWKSRFVSLLHSVQEDLFVGSPYISRGALRLIAEELSQTGVLAETKVTVLTDLSVGNIAGGWVDVGGLVQLINSAPNTRIHHLPSLHAKLYIADSHSAVVSSANLTEGGLVRNTEYGIQIKAPALVRAIRQDAQMYAALGAHVPLQTLQRFASAAATLTKLRDELSRSTAKRLQDALENKLDETHLAVLRCRAFGESTHSILARTLLFVLRRGPMRTPDIHPLIQSIHPDLCDDTVDRVIDGVHFGKRWKHYVRNAQQHLKRTGLVVFDGICWSLTAQGKVASDQL